MKSNCLYYYMYIWYTLSGIRLDNIAVWPDIPAGYYSQSGVFDIPSDNWITLGAFLTCTYKSYKSLMILSLVQWTQFGWTKSRNSDFIFKFGLINGNSQSETEIHFQHFTECGVFYMPSNSRHGTHTCNCASTQYLLGRRTRGTRPPTLAFARLLVCTCPYLFHVVIYLSICFT